MRGSPSKNAACNTSNITNMADTHPLLTILFPLLETPTTSVPHVFCDMDGVVANFYGGMQREFGVPQERVNDFLVNKNGWAIITKENPHLFATLPILFGARELISGLTALRDGGRIQLSMLTAIPTEWYVDPVMRKISTQDKIQWITRHFQKIPAKNVLVVRREDKQHYAKAQRAIGHPAPILIDDFLKNIREWEMAGGVGIHHTSAHDSLQQLAKLLN